MAHIIQSARVPQVPAMYSVYSARPPSQEHERQSGCAFRAERPPRPSTHLDTTFVVRRGTPEQHPLNPPTQTSLCLAAWPVSSPPHTLDTISVRRMLSRLRRHRSQWLPHQEHPCLPGASQSGAILPCSLVPSIGAIIILIIVPSFEL